MEPYKDIMKGRIMMSKKRKFAKRKKWTEEDVELLIRLREKYTKKDIAKKMKRSPSSISNKVRELGLGGLMDNTDLWNFQQATEAIGCSKGVIHKTWVRHGLKYVKRGYYCLVSEKELTRFMKEHPELWDATKCDYYMFYKYPWFLKKLEEDKNRDKSSTYFWTDYQKQQLVMMKRRGFTHQQIAKAIGKTKRAVDHYSIKINVG